MTSKTAGKQLTLDLIFTKTRSDNLQNIKNLNLWGNDLEDLSLIEKMPNLEVVSLSVNRISSLRDFGKCPKLQLYLRKNSISDLSQIMHLVKLPNLKVLWLHDNPCAQEENYREVIIKHLPALMKLDNNPVTSEERINSQKLPISFAHSNLGSGHKRSDERISGHNNSVFEDLTKVEEKEHRQRSRGSQIIEEKPRKEEIREQRYSIKEQFKGVSPQSKPPQLQHQSSKGVERNQNITMAVLSLLQELDPSSLEIIRRETEKLIGSTN